MRLLNGNFPTELDMNEVGIEIQVLSERENLILPQLKEVFRAQVKSAENQLRIVRTELGAPGPVLSTSRILQKLIAKRWGKLSATLMMAEAYCS